MSTVLVHDWLLFEAGAEKVLAEMAKLFPGPIYTLFSDKQVFAGCDVRPSKLNVAKTFYRHLLPFYPRAVQRFDLSEADLILSSSHAVAKGIRKRPDQLHICYCHTPMRYVWDLEGEYRQMHGLDRGAKKWVADRVFPKLREFDRQAQVDFFIANSQTVAERIKRLYGREATVIYPPVDVEKFPLVEKKEEFYLAHSRLVPYKRVDLVVKAFAKMPQRKLVVMGSGPEEKKLRKLATPNVTFLGWQKETAEVLGKARALIFPAFEDFGIIPVEAMACGTPVIAYGKGGVTETVNEKTGLFFHDQEAIVQAVEEFEEKEQMFDPRTIRNHALKFSRERFTEEFSQFVTHHLTCWRTGKAASASDENGS